ncbi:hypothetical protein GCM10011389_40690 [Pontibacillus salipaludis]|uniref:Uncharacterized protein n=1 Tax=Pontibacillus salipaludis TaxID=1697394 RepID=A0ABQ1QIU5_9BACI|nr:hypothetical protein GCM10011389_40690 [Pontibacillus salipaludis]
MTRPSTPFGANSVPKATAEGRVFAPELRCGIRAQLDVQGVAKDARNGLFMTMRKTGSYREKGVGEAVKKDDREAERIVRRDLQERFLEDDSADDARRLYATKNDLVRTKYRLKKSTRTTERRKAPRCSDVRILREFRAGSPERLYERQREKAGETTDGRGTRAEVTGCP